MESSEDYRNPMAREKVVKLLESTIKDMNWLAERRLPTNVRELEDTIMKRAQSRDEYIKNVKNLLQIANQRSQYPPQQQMQYDAQMGGQRPGGGMMPGPSIMATSGPQTDGMQQQQLMQSSGLQPNAAGQMPSMPQQHHYTMGQQGQQMSAMDASGRMLQPPPNPYAQQQQQQVHGNVQQMNMQQGRMMMSSQQPQQIVPQAQIRQMARGQAMRMPPGGPQGGMMMQDGQRYPVPQERTNEYMRPMTRVARPQMPQAQQWGGTPNVGTNMVAVSSAGAPMTNETVVVTHFGPGSTIRQQQPPVRTDPMSTMSYQQQMAQQHQQQYSSGAARGMPMIPQQQSQQPQQPLMVVQQPTPNMAQPQRFLDQTRTPMPQPPGMQQQMRYMGAQQSNQGMNVSMMAPPGGPMPAPNVASSGQYVPMPSPSTSNIGPSPAANQQYMHDQSPAYPSGPIGSVGQPKYNAAGGAEPSPATQAPAEAAINEDPQYREKIMELRTYVDALKRLLDQQFPKEGDRNSPQAMKFINIIEIIEGRRKCTLDVLQKCEDTIKKIVRNNEAAKTRESALCQPLFEVVASLAKMPNAAETLKRVFDLPHLDGSTAKRLCVSKSVENNEIKTIEQAFTEKMTELGLINIISEKTSEDKVTSKLSNSGQPASVKVPVNIQREIASLEPRFRISLDRNLSESSRGNDRAIHVICGLEDRRLPHVPALRLQIPHDYPVSSPKYDNDFLEYYGTPFLDSVREMLSARLTKLGTNCSITALLDSWESTVCRACAT